MTRLLQPKKGRAGLYVGLLLAVGACMVCLRHCSTPRADHSADLRPGGDTVNVAIEYSPLAVMSADGDSLTGFGYELMEALAADNGLHVHYHPIVSLSNALERLDSGYFDIVIAEMTVTAEFRERYRFTEPVFLDRQVLVQRRDTAGRLAVANQLDLARRGVTVVARSGADDRLRSLAREIGDTIYVTSDSLHSPEQIFLLAAAGEIPLAVINASTARALASDYPDMDISTAVSFTQFRSWALGRHNEALSDTLDAALRRFKDTARYRALIDKYGISPAQ